MPKSKIDPAVNPLSLAANFSEEEQKAIASYIGVPLEDPAFKPMLGIAQHLGLSPILGEIWLVESERFDRSSGEWVECLRPAVGHDGFLKHARDKDNFLTVRSNFVCANDHFRFKDDGREVTIDHSATITKGEGETPRDALERASGSEESHRPLTAEADARGPVLGAWAKLFYRDDTPPFFYYARVSEHGKTRNTGRDGEEPQEDWAGAWGYTAAMASKCARSYVMRIGLGVSGVVPVDELRGGPDSGLAVGGRSSVSDKPQREQGVTNESIVEDMEGVSKPTKKKLIAALTKVNELAPFSWATAKVAVLLEGGDEEAAKRVLAEVEGEIKKLQRA